MTKHLHTKQENWFWFNSQIMLKRQLHFQQDRTLEKFFWGQTVLINASDPCTNTLITKCFKIKLAIIGITWNS